jgi:hypothetical protein
MIFGCRAAVISRSIWSRITPAPPTGRVSTPSSTITHISGGSSLARMA